MTKGEGQATREDEAVVREALREALERLPRVGRYWIAFSGGPDSHVLLDAMVRLRAEPGAGIGAELAAAHVNHGLQPDAQAWERHCRRVCEDAGVALEVLRAAADAGPGESPEAAARRARYAALAPLVGSDAMLLTGHHRQDQAETVLVQLLRGAGPHGLAAMPECAPFGHGWLGRPLLEVGLAALRAYHRARGLDSAEDRSNLDPRYTRNFIRHEILPRLRARWPSAGRTLARVAAQQAEAASLVDALAAIDLEAARGERPDSLHCPALTAMSEARCRNALCAWLRELDLPPPGAAQLHHIVRDVLHARADRQPVVRWPGAEIRRYRERLYAMPPLAPCDPRRVLAWDLHTPLALPCGRLEAEPAYGQGLAARVCEPGRVEIRFRRGGERCRPAGRGGTHSLKKIFQERGVPPWQRDQVPLVYIGGELAAVAGWWVCEPFEAAPGERGWVLRWRCPPGPGEAAAADLRAPTRAPSSR